VLIDKDGTRYVLASPETVTWHAGKSWFNGKENANNTTVGIEFQGNTLEEPLTDDQIRSAIEYLRPVMKKYDIPSDRIVTHEQIRQEWKRRHPKSNVPDKRDITPDEYSRFMNALNDSIANGSWNDLHKE
ncbi:MAG: N-acetylmuramoyl-L-alanine amidase, partial [Muribaculaceae bacterium]|nr:N-acetylmuramoyl-L-alanine amidase [Muribaculaceae bacterium]